MVDPNSVGAIYDRVLLRLHGANKRTAYSVAIRVGRERPASIVFYIDETGVAGAGIDPWVGDLAFEFSPAYSQWPPALQRAARSVPGILSRSVDSVFRREVLGLKWCDLCGVPLGYPPCTH